MTAKRVVVVDTNIFISALLSATGEPRRLFRTILDQQIELLLSESVYAELTTRLLRPKFDRYRDAEAWNLFLDELIELATWCPDVAIEPICRDPDDDKFLALAVSGDADAIISGDKDLLDLRTYDGIPIMTPAAFMQALAG
jgi:putative PIN family toxin of toxin-antitoxin system